MDKISQSLVRHILKKIGVKYSSVADIIGVYFRNAGQVFEDRQHRVPIYENYTFKPYKY